MGLTPDPSIDFEYMRQLLGEAGPQLMSMDCSADLEGNGKSGAAILGRNFRCGTFSNGPQERLQLET